MTNELRNTFSDSALKQATILGMIDYIRLTTRYIDEIRQNEQPCAKSTGYQRLQQS